MGTVAITASGFSALAAGAPAGWPAAITWPGTQSPNGTKTYTISDADWVKILTWIALTQPTLSPTPTAPQILLAWLQATIATPTIAGVQGIFTPAPVPPTPVVIT